jgi:hypothetical protein
LYTTVGPPAFDPSVAPPKIFAKYALSQKAQITALDSSPCVPRQRSEKMARFSIVNAKSALDARRHLSMNRRATGAHREPVHRIANCLRRRFSIASFDSNFGCGSPVPATGVPLQTAHDRHAIASTARHCPRINSGVKHIFSSQHFVYRDHLHKLRLGVPCNNFAPRFLTIKSQNAGGVVHYHARFRERSMNAWWKIEEVSRKGAKSRSEETN